ncbi:MAG: hypothetical protein A3I11_06380 [Elusimicrobia bacterium RIFCSPLOWO2_02_FULL_39_32]|nr:MAG: hypothetical protein A2034_07045 [Elusimicrobia bacterium GWA2_38_7]OGR81260.1 MAG: hypothetical protein A3B80_08990 [Elusimicrobia bacterium RIFCSPHIGHO2_02_FULL_39_36]OGR91812.1 MAG: hypothetical protein A3I11_06380 [Elusimicrobia bacterium RIFCSPLOWO2_02_FULL_39_32]OGR98471.1 MAG: hypothetical protein A3G85_02240 [Elusimicrobia bacterium RIFCSPLOWO2_12_FULL_39_28]
MTAEEFDAKFERGENIFKYLDFKNALAVKKINVDFPIWMVKLLDEEAKKLNISRQAVIKTWIHDRLLNIPQFSHKGRF